MKTRYLIYTLALLAFCACSHEDDFMPTQGSAIPMGVSVNISDAVATRAETEMTDLQANSFMLDVQPASSGSEADEYTYADVCVKYVDGDGWGFYEADGTTKKQLMWVNANAETSFTATYPEVSGWSFNADQSTGLANDWLCFNKTLTYNETTGGQVPVMFQHTNTKLTVNLTIDETVHAGKTIKSVTVGGTKIAFTKYDVNTGYTLADDAGDITPYTNGNTYEAILLPQTADLKVTVMFEGDDNEYVWEQANTELIGGCHYTVNLKVTKKQLISIGTVTVSPWTEVEDPIDAGTATEPEATYSISGTSATITVPSYVSAESVKAAITAVAADASVTTIVVDGTLTDAQQTILATALEGNTTPKIVFEDMNLADLSDDVKWMGNLIDTADGAILEVGSCGENAKYMIYHTGDDSSRTIRIEGTGAITNYTTNNYAPWFDQNSYQIPNNITTVEIAEGITTVGKLAFFYGRGIVSVTLPESITSIEYSAFMFTSLKSITIQKYVTYIGAQAFSISNLESVTVLATTPPTLNENQTQKVFSGYSDDFIIYVPSESVAEYESKWSAYADKIQAIQAE